MSHCVSRRLILIPPCKSQNTQISPCGTKSTQKMNEKPLETIIIWGMMAKRKGAQNERLTN